MKIDLAKEQEASLQFDISDCVFRALCDLSEAWPITVNARPRRNHANTARCLLAIALANIEIIAPRMRSMIKYADAEGLNQADYLESLISAKFKKKLHRAGTNHDPR